jgi:hypothetical protein
MEAHAKVNNIKFQPDYFETMRLIDLMISKEVSISGSVVIGKKYAEYYKEKIEKMLQPDYIDLMLLEELKKKVVVDLEYIREDNQKRFASKNTFDNDRMMSMILDFILSI